MQESDTNCLINAYMQKLYETGGIIVPMIRTAQYEDISAILTIYNDAILNSTTTFDEYPQTLEERKRWFLEHTSDKYPVVCLIDGEQVLAWGSLSPYRNRAAYRYSVECSVYVDSAYQAQGYGRQILSELLNRSKRLGYHLVIGCIESTNIASLKLSYSLGFTYAGELKGVGYKFGRWLDTTFVQKLL
jgi:L-amino acid N-acyltransferase